MNERHFRLSSLFPCSLHWNLTIGCYPTIYCVLCTGQCLHTATQQQRGMQCSGQKGKAGEPFELGRLCNHLVNNYRRALSTALATWCTNGVFGIGDAPANMFSISWACVIYFLAPQCYWSAPGCWHDPATRHVLLACQQVQLVLLSCSGLWMLLCYIEKTKWPPFLGSQWYI